MIGGEQEPLHDRHIYSENTREVAVSVRNETWLAIKDLKTLEHTPKYKHIKDRLQLYNRLNDPKSLLEGSLAHPHIAAGFEKELATWFEQETNATNRPG